MLEPENKSTACRRRQVKQCNSGSTCRWFTALSCQQPADMPIQAARPRGRPSFQIDVRDTCASNRHFFSRKKAQKITEYRDTAPLKVQSRAHLNRRPFSPKSAVYHLGYLGIDECERKNPLKHVGDRHGVLDFRSGKEVVVRLNKLV